MYRSAKTGKIVSATYAHRYPHLVIEQKPEKKVRVVKKADRQDEVPQQFVPLLGEKCLHNGNIIAITSFEPLTATVYKRVDNVATSNPYTLDSIEGCEPIAKQTLFEMLY